MHGKICVGAASQSLHPIWLASTSLFARTRGTPVAGLRSTEEDASGTSVLDTGTKLGEIAVAFGSATMRKSPKTRSTVTCVNAHWDATGDAAALIPCALTEGSKTYSTYEQH